MKTLSLTLLDSRYIADLRVDASALSIDQLHGRTGSQIAELVLDSNVGPIRLGELFTIEFGSSVGEQASVDRLVLRGDLSRFDGLCASTRFGSTIVVGSVGNDFAKTQQGGWIYVDGSVGQRALSDKRGGFCLIGGNAADGFGSPLPGKLQGIQGGDSIVLGNLGHRACERMRRGILCVGGNIGQHLAHQWIAGTILGMQHIGHQWCAHMRRGSLIVRGECPANPGATLSAYRRLELSFLPILWRHLRELLAHAAMNSELSLDLQARCEGFRIGLPTGRQVLRSIGDRECEGQGEVLVLQD